MPGLSGRFRARPARYAAALLDTVDFLAETSPTLPLGSSGLWRIRQLKGRLALIMRGGVPRACHAPGLRRYSAWPS